MPQETNGHDPLSGVVVPFVRTPRAAEPLPPPAPAAVPGPAPEGAGEHLVEDAPPPVLVDQAAEVEPGDLLAELAARRAERRPVLAPWLRSRADALRVLGWHAEHAAYLLGYHAGRAPLYAGRLAVRAPRGAAWAVRDAARWAGDAEGRARIRELGKTATADYLSLTARHDARVRTRAAVVAGAAVAVLLAGILIRAAAPGLVQWLALGAALAALGRYGTRADQMVFDRAVTPARVERLTSDIVVRALGALGIAEIGRAVARKEGITFPAPIVRDGPGWRAEVDLPYGVTVTDVMERRAKLASGLRRPLGCVWPEPATEQHPGRLVLWVGDVEMRKAKQPAWPLLRDGRADLFRPLPYGSDQRGRPVEVLLMFTNVLIGAMPRYGKTFALRVLLLACALDALAELRLFELKGTGDLKALEKVAHHYGCGAKDAVKAACVASLKEVYEDLERRADVIAGLPPELCPEFKVTPELVAMRHLRLHPVVVAIDECQELFADETCGAEAEKYATAIIKRGPALGIILILATQRPDKDSLPTGVSANVGVRVCLRVMGQVENDMVLGTSSYREGIRATSFTALDKGISYAVGIGEDPMIVRSAYLDAAASELVTLRARALREAAGTLTGHAAGEHAEQAPAVDVLADVLAVVGPGEAKVWNSRIVDRLVELRPDFYGRWASLDEEDKTAALTAELKRYGVPVGQVWGTAEDGKGANRRGVERRALLDALDARRI